MFIISLLFAFARAEFVIQAYFNTPKTMNSCPAETPLVLLATTQDLKYCIPSCEEASQIVGYPEYSNDVLNWNALENRCEDDIYDFANATFSNIPYTTVSFFGPDCQNMTHVGFYPKFTFGSCVAWPTESAMAAIFTRNHSKVVVSLFEDVYCNHLVLKTLSRIGSCTVNGDESFLFSQ